MNYESNEEDHYKNYNKINLALDTFPFPGVTTSLDAILMGVPVLTMSGFNFCSRFGSSINKNIGISDFIANSHENIFLKQKNLFKTTIYMKNGNKLREKAINSSLFDTKNFAKDFEILLNKVLT